jgi:hypothetical protein
MEMYCLSNGMHFTSTTKDGPFCAAGSYSIAHQKEYHTGSTSDFGCCTWFILQCSSEQKRFYEGTRLIV